MIGLDEIARGAAKHFTGLGWAVFTENVKGYGGGPFAVVAAYKTKAVQYGPRFVDRHVYMETIYSVGRDITRAEFYDFAKAAGGALSSPVSFAGRYVMPGDAEIYMEDGKGVCRFALNFVDEAESAAESTYMEELLL